MSKLELDSLRIMCSTKEAVGGSVTRASPSVKRVSKGKWKRCELGLKGAETEQSGFSQQRKRQVYKRSSGRWQSEIRNPITKARVYLGTFDTVGEAEEAYDNKRRKFDLLICGHTNDACEADATVQGKGNSNCVSNEPLVTTNGSSVIKDDEGMQSGGSIINVNGAENEKSGYSQQRKRQVYKRSSGRWQSQIRNPITKARVYLGTFDTLGEAEEAYDNKMREFDLMICGHTNDTCEADATVQGKGNSNCVSNEPLVTTNGSSVIKDGEGMQSGGSMINVNGAENEKSGYSQQRKRQVYKRSSSRWQSQIRNPITKARVYLGTFDTLGEAEEAYDNKRREFDLMICGHTNDTCEADATVQGKGNSNCVSNEPLVTTNGSSVIKDGEGMQSGGSMINVNGAENEKSGYSQQRKRQVYKRSSGRWQSQIRNPITKGRVYLGTFDTLGEAEEAYDNKRREFDLIICGHTNDTCEADATVQGKGHSNCVSNEPLVTTDGSSVIKDGDGMQRGGSMINVNAAETMGEFDLDVVDSYGRLIGEPCRTLSSNCVHESSPSPTNDADFVNHNPCIQRLESGTWVAKIQHPISKVWVLLGTYATPEEAEESCTRKKLEYESCSVQKSTPSSFHTSIKDCEKHPGIERRKSGKWAARIRHNNERIRLGLYTTPKEAAEAYILSKLELNSQKTACLRRESGSGSVYQVSQGKRKAVLKRKKVRLHLGTCATAEVPQEAINRKRCELGLKVDTEKTGVSQQSEIGNPITKSRARLETLDSSHEADEAYNHMMREFDIIADAHKKLRCEDDAIAEVAPEAINRKRCGLGLKVDTEKTGIGNPLTKTRAHLGTLDSEHVADEAYNNMMREFDIMVHAHKKSRCEDDAIAEGKSDSACVSDELFVPTDGGLGIKVIKEEETGDRMINENVESPPIFVTEIEREFDLGIVDCYGQFVGEYSRLDDELWFCKYKDDAIL